MEYDAQDEQRPFYPDHLDHPEYTGHILPHIGVCRGSLYCDRYKEASYTNMSVLEKRRNYGDNLGLRITGNH